MNNGGRPLRRVTRIYAFVVGAPVAGRGQPLPGRRQLGDRTGTELPRNEHGEHAQGGPEPVLVADHGDALVHGGMARGERHLLTQRVALGLPQFGTEEVEQPDLATGGDLPTQHRIDGALEVVVDLSDRLESDRAHGMSGICSSHCTQTKSLAPRPAPHLQVWAPWCRADVPDCGASTWADPRIGPSRVMGGRPQSGSVAERRAAGWRGARWTRCGPGDGGHGP